MSQETRDRRIRALKQEIQELESSLPAHSIPPSMLIRLEELEDELVRLEQPGDAEQAPG